MCLCFNNFIFVFVQWLLKIIEGDVWVVSLYYIKKRLNNCFNCTTKLNERPSSFSRVLGCPASPPLRVCWLVHLRWKKQTFDMVVGKCSRSKKIERRMFYQNCCCCCCWCCCCCTSGAAAASKQPNYFQAANCFRHLLFSFFSKTFR